MILFEAIPGTSMSMSISQDSIQPYMGLVIFVKLSIHLLMSYIVHSTYIYIYIYIYNIHVCTMYKYTYSIFVYMHMVHQKKNLQYLNYIEVIFRYIVICSALTINRRLQLLLVLLSPPSTRAAIIARRVRRKCKKSHFARFTFSQTPCFFSCLCFSHVGYH